MSKSVGHSAIKCLHKLILQQTGIVGVNNEQSSMTLLNHRKRRQLITPLPLIV